MVQLHKLDLQLIQPVFPAATGHTVQNAGLPYKSANIGGFQQPSNQFNANLGYTQISSTTNQTDMGKKLSDLPVYC